MKPADLFNILKENNINCFCGVPDSLLKDFCAYITDHTDPKQHTITANEGNAVGLAAGHYLVTGNPACVYMQNSGIGNCVNPLLSLTDEEVYNIPVLMFIGWRGEPDKKDEPQHIKQGKVTDKLLDAMGICYEILPQDFDAAKILLKKAFRYMKETDRPFAFIVRKGTFEKYTLKNKKHSEFELKREDAIETIVKHLKPSDVVVSTTGHISRELYEIRERLNQSHKYDFLTVGSMGHSSSIALGIALEKSDRDIYCFDGDGAFLMHQGAATVNASKELTNFKHIILNNEAHDSVGAQPTAVYKSNLSELALACGYEKAFSVKTQEELEKILPEFMNSRYCSFLEIKVKCGAREDLGRPKEKPQENKKIFMENLAQMEFIHRGAVENLSTILNTEKSGKLLIFTGKKSFEKIKNRFEKETIGCKIEYYNDFEVNPKKEDIETALQNIKPDFDIIIAIGGGSVIDFAKAYRYYTKSEKKLIAIPTTSGTGSETTQFAVIYIDGVKHSLDDVSILPEYAIVDSEFSQTASKYLKACSAMDAFCHAIESYWSIKSTPLSREYSKQAMELCRDNIVDYVNTNNTEAAETMAIASNLAGKAINISRTTAAHALSYALTSLYGLPHGHAAALSIGKLAEINAKITDECCNDARGSEFVEKRMQEIQNILNTNNPAEYFSKLLKKIDLSEPENIDIKKIAESVNLDRLNNNPYKLSNQDLLYILGGHK